ncbi:hypothetical protein C8Q74DRAFT_1270480 [Fomes fomentarius]|nr:hypothetical protein C8Q74DRAFT_1270480 [Fomes fomentarius]
MLISASLFPHRQILCLQSTHTCTTMSDDSQTAQLVEGYNTLQLQFYVSTAVFSLLAYEYVITFDREMKLFWRRTINGSSILFIVNRYLSLVYSALGMPFPDPTTNKSCTAEYYIIESLGLLQYLPWALFSALRAYALCSRTCGQWSISILVLLSSLAPLILNFVNMGYWSITGASDGPCVVVDLLSVTIQNHLTIVSRVCLIASDLLVMCITWNATYKTSRDSIKVLGQGNSLSSILFRNGTLYFSILVTLNILHLSFTLLSIVNTQDSVYANNQDSFVVRFSEPLTAILISRFLMDLQEVKNTATYQHSQVSSMSSRVIGSLGSSLPAPGETFEVQSVPQSNGETEMERVDSGVVVPDGAP